MAVSQTTDFVILLLQIDTSNLVKSTKQKIPSNVPYLVGRTTVRLYFQRPGLDRIIPIEGKKSRTASDKDDMEEVLHKDSKDIFALSITYTCFLFLGHYCS